MINYNLLKSIYSLFGYRLLKSKWSLMDKMHTVFTGAIESQNDFFHLCIYLQRLVSDGIITDHDATSVAVPSDKTFNFQLIFLTADLLADREMYGHVPIRMRYA